MHYSGLSASRFSASLKGAPVRVMQAVRFGKAQESPRRASAGFGFDIPGPAHPTMLKAGEQANAAFLAGFNTLVQMTNLGYAWMRMMGMGAFLPDGSYSRRIQAESEAMRRKALGS